MIMTCIKFVVLFTALCLTGVLGAALLSTKDVNEDSKPSICYNRTPCAWAVYVPFTRKIDYVMNNTCVCNKGKSCLRTDDDLSVSAYVYRCKVRTNNMTSGELYSTTLPS